ncbi:MAG: glycogen-binding domain-containing protein [Treponema sp.]|nr:glycogen-binding domain-containing protein [Treponema sp.]
MKKVLAFVSSVLLLASAAFADVSVKKLDDGKVEVTFFYANPRAGEVLVAGDFTNWQDGAEPMEKGEKGFTLVKVVPAGTIMKYKFISDGNWTEDIHEPDKVDDGFGGHNGLIDVDELVAASAGSAEGSAPSKKSAVKLQTWSMVGAQNKWSLTDGKMAEDSLGIGVKSYWKFSGNITPHVPVYAEIAVAENDGFSNIYSEEEGKKIGAANAWKNGAKGLADIAIDPIAYANGGAEKTYLGHFKTGIETPYVNFNTGYKYAKLPPHTNVNWVTVDKEWEAGYSAVGGYGEYSLGSAAKEAISSLTNGNVSLEAVVAPNKSADRAGNQYGIYSYVDATLFGSHYVDFQFNSAFGKTIDTFFTKAMEDDFILGYRGDLGPVTVKANGLFNLYGANEIAAGYKTLYSPASSDVGKVNDAPKNYLDNAAANLNVYYSNDFVDVTVGGRFRGAQASMMYVEEGADDHTNISDQLGSLNRMRAWIDATVYPVSFLSVGLNPYFEMTLNKASKSSFKDKDNYKIYLKPSFTFDFIDIAFIDAILSGYTEMSYNTSKDDAVKYGTSEATQFGVEEGGLKFEMNLDNDVVPHFDVFYGYDANDADLTLHTLIAEADLPLGIAAQIGAGLRTTGTKLDSNPFGFFLGANKQINQKFKTILYSQFVYNMDPYKAFGDGQDALNLDGLTLDSAANNYKNAAAVRVAVRFDF